MIERMSYEILIGCVRSDCIGQVALEPFDVEIHDDITGAFVQQIVHIQVCNNIAKCSPHPPFDVYHHVVCTIDSVRV